MPRSAKSVSTECFAVLVIALAMALLAGCDGSGGIVAGDQDTTIDFGETDTTKQLDIQNTSDQDVTFELLVNYGDGPKDWLTYGPITAECGPAQSVVFTLEADRNALPAGLWEAEVVVTSGAIRKSVIVSIAVVAAATNINTHNFWTSSEPLEFAVWNAGGGELQFEVAKVPAWLAVENGTGASTGPTDRKTVTLSPNRSGLEPGTYSDRVVILPVNGLSAFRKTIDVTMTVLPPGVPALTIQATPTSGNAPLEVQFKAMNGLVLADSPTAGYTINWDFGDDTTVGQGNQVSHRFASSGTFLVTLSLVGALGTFNCHEATITVNSDPAQPGALVVTPTDYAMFSGPPGGPFTPTGATYTLKNTGGKSISWSAGTAAPSWVSLSKSSGTLAGGATDTVTVKVNTNANTMVVGNYSGGVVFVNASNGAVITTRTVSLKITPVAKDDSYSTNEDKTLNVMAVAGVLANDPGHGQLPAVLVSGPSHGSVTLNPNGMFSYTPTANFNGSDSFSYKLTDGTLSSNTATVSITVKPVNDPPSFTVPADQSMSLNSTIQVAMSSVSPGPADEAGQTVTFTATSSNQAVVRDADLRFDNSDDRQLTITAIGTGSTTITVKATDDGGTTDDRGIANGGADTTTKTFGVTAFDGVPISGTISLVETVGAQPKFGQHGLKFTGTGPSTGQNYTTLTDVDGHYTQPVPEGWTGTITAGDSTRCILFPATTTISTPVTAPLTGQNLQAWVPPIGVPMPSFGIREQAPASPSPWSSTVASFYYVDNTHPSSTDTSNANGYPAKPRKTIPQNLPAGSVVEVHGGPYDSSPNIPTSWTGSLQNPIFVMGQGTPRFTRGLGVYNDRGGGGAYVIIDGISCYKINIGKNYHHVVLRNSDVYGDENGGGTSIATNNVTLHINDIVFYNNTIHDNGNWSPQAPGDRDFHGIAIGWQSLAERIWVVDNDIYHNEGDAVQINAAPSFPNSNVTHIYVGRNKLHDNKQSGVALKSSDHVIVTENDIYGHRTSSSALGPGIGFSDEGPETAWFIFNRIHDNSLGIKLSGGASPGPYYIIGNVIYDIHGDGSPFSGNWSQPGQAVADWHHAPKYFIANTVYDTDYGYCVWSTGWTPGQNLILANSIFSQMRSDAPMIHTDSESAASVVTVRNDLFDGAFQVHWAGMHYTSLASFQAGTGQGADCLTATSGFVDATNGDFDLTGNSQAIDRGTLDSAVYQTFVNLYNIDIRLDMNHHVRPLDGNADGAAEYDMGALEYQP